MDSLLRLYGEWVNRNQNVISALLFDPRENPSTTFGYHASYHVILVENKPPYEYQMRQLQVGGVEVCEHRFSQWHLEQRLVQGLDENLIARLRVADIMYDPHKYTSRLKERLVHLPLTKKTKSICEEYSAFLQHFFQAKQQIKKNHPFDAYCSVLHALCRWARLALYQVGESIGLNLWAQVKQVDPSTYKLYEELIAGSEILKKRVELVMLPLEFHLVSNMKGSTVFLVDILKSRQSPWTVRELMQHPELQSSSIHVPLLLSIMAKKSLVQEVLIRSADDYALEKTYSAIF